MYTNMDRKRGVAGGGSPPPRVARPPRALKAHEATPLFYKLRDALMGLLGDLRDRLGAAGLDK